MNLIDRVAETLRTVLPDLATLASPPMDLTVTRIDGSIYIEQSGEINGGDELDDRQGAVQLLADVADAVQSHISWAAGDEVWPVCPLHGFGLHPEVVNSSAQWICRPHNHPVARIGHLTT